MEPTYQVARAILKPFLGLWFDWTIEGIENIPSKGGAILAVNHIAYLDPLALCWVANEAKRRPRFLAKAELFEDKRIRWVLNGTRQIPVQRGSKNAPMALDQAVDALHRGELVIIFPEGTITTDADLNPMAAKTGAARLALLANVPLIPMAVWGTQNVWPKGFQRHWWPPKQDILARIDPPMHVTGDPNSPQDWRRVGDEVMQRIARLVASLRPVVADRRRPKKKAA